MAGLTRRVGASGPPLFDERRRGNTRSVHVELMELASAREAPEEA